jgi:sulfide:quinone oxidoreductase
MIKHLLILGGGTAGTMMANHLRRRLPASEWRMTVVDRSDEHLYQPGFLFLPFGKYQESDIIRQTRDFIPRGVGFVHAKGDQYTPESHAVTLKDGQDFEYDLLIVATACRADL